MARSVRLRLWAGLAAGVVVAAVPVAATAASASSGPGRNTLARSNPRDQRGQPCRARCPSAPPRRAPRKPFLSSLESGTCRSWKRPSPGASENYVSVGQFAREYGANPALIGGLERYLRRFGITTSAYADNVDVVANGTAGEFDQALAVTQQQYKVPELRGRDGHAGRPGADHPRHRAGP